MTGSNQTTDQRVLYARGFLAGTRRQTVAELPPSVLMREDAELRRVLAHVLDVIGQSAVFDAGQREVLGRALTDAITYRGPGGACPRCEASPSGLCDDHAIERDLTGAYLALARELGIEVGHE